MSAVTVLAASLGAAALSACAGAAGFEDASPTARAPSAAVLVDFRRSGGLAGVNDRLLVRSSGRASLRGKTFRVAPATMRRLRRALREFPTLRADHRSRPPAADDFQYEVVYKRRTVRADGQALRRAETPKALREAVSILSALVDSRRR